MGKNRSRLENVNIEGLRTKSMSLAKRANKSKGIDAYRISIHGSSISQTHHSPDMEDQLTLRAEIANSMEKMAKKGF